MSRPSSRHSALSAHSAASLRSTGSFSPVRASSGFGAPICGRPGASIAQFDPWLKPDWRPPRNSFKYGSAEPARVGERLLAVGDEASKPVGVKELWRRVDTDRLLEAEHRVRLLSATWRSQSGAPFSVSTGSLSVRSASPEASASWSFGQEPTIGMYERPGSVGVGQGSPTARTGSFRASRSLPRSFAGAAARPPRGSPEHASLVPSSTVVAASTTSAVAGGSGAQSRAASWLTTEQRAWLSRPTTADNASNRRAGVQQREQRRQQQQQRRAAPRREPGGPVAMGWQTEADARNQLGDQDQSRARHAQEASSSAQQWRLSL